LLGSSLGGLEWPLLRLEAEPETGPICAGDCVGDRGDRGDRGARGRKLVRTGASGFNPGCGPDVAGRRRANLISGNGLQLSTIPCELCSSREINGEPSGPELEPSRRVPPGVGDAGAGASAMLLADPGSPQEALEYQIRTPSTDSNEQNERERRERETSENLPPRPQQRHGEGCAHRVHRGRGGKHEHEHRTCARRPHVPLRGGAAQHVHL
jgi:hypothetical protein